MFTGQEMFHRVRLLDNDVELPLNSQYWFCISNELKRRRSNRISLIHSNIALITDHVDLCPRSFCDGSAAALFNVVAQWVLDVSRENRTFFND